jgi:hypothetical protein
MRLTLLPVAYSQTCLTQHITYNAIIAIQTAQQFKANIERVLTENTPVQLSPKQTFSKRAIGRLVDQSTL